MGTDDNGLAIGPSGLRMIGVGLADGRMGGGEGQVGRGSR
jgi:hypothetical protein